MQTKVLTGALVFLTLCFISFVWWVWSVTENKIHIAIPIIITLLPLILGIVIFVIRRIQARKGSRQLEAAITGPSASVESGEILRLRGEFENAVNALKKSKLAQGDDGRDALYRLPWYTIIGPPACGKTTVLRNSGLRFPDVPGMGQRYKVKGIGGTRNCDWFLTNRAVILDTAGRWTVQEEDHDEWMAFLDMLKKFRSKRPLNGLIAAINIDDLARSDGSEVEEFAANMRQRIDEVIGRLGIVLPVYVLFTKCDLVRGFVETFSDMSKQEREQIWGFTAPLSRSIGHPTTFFEDRFDELSDALERRALPRLADEGDPTVLRYIYDFPAQFSSLRSKLSLFINSLFEENPFQETPVLRGCYFTSGTQEGAPADIIFDGLAEKLKIRHLLPNVQPDTQPKAYFLHDMLMDVVFKDQNIATTSHSEITRQRRRTIIWTSIVLFAAVMLAVVPGFAFVQNNTRLNATSDLVANWYGNKEPRLDAPVEVEELQKLHETLNRYEHGWLSFWTGFGMYRGNTVLDSMKRYYGNVLKEYVIRPLLDRDSREMRIIVSQVESLRNGGNRDIVSLSSADHTRLLNQVKLQLLLIDSRPKEIPSPFSQEDFIKKQVVSSWQSITRTEDKKELNFYKEVVERYLQLLKEEDKQDGQPTLAIDGIDTDTLQGARAVLSSKNPIDRALNALITELKGYDQNLASLIGDTVAIQSQGIIPGAFTREAWQHVYQMIEKGSVWEGVGEQWVFAPLATLEAEKIDDNERKQLLRTAYFRKYQESWRDFIDQLSVSTPNNLIDANTILQELVRQDGPLNRLLQQVKVHTELPDPSQTIASTLADKAPMAAGAAIKALNPVVTDRNIINLAAAFKPFTGFSDKIAAFQAQLQQILIALRAYQEDKTKFDALSTASENAVSALDAMIIGCPQQERMRWEKLLKPPVEGVYGIIVEARYGILAKSWCDEVYAPFIKELAGFYPFSDSQDEATLDAFQKFFKPEQGTLWAYFNKYLRNRVVDLGSGFSWTKTKGISGSFSDDLLAYLRRASRITDVFFQQGISPTAQLDFEVKVLGASDLQKTEISVGGKSVPYFNGALVWVPMTWPGEEPQVGASLKVVRSDLQPREALSKQGVWGFLKLLDHGRIKSSSERQFRVFWLPKKLDQQVEIEFKFKTAVRSYLGSKKLRNAKPPSKILVGGAGCRVGT